MEKDVAKIALTLVKQAIAGEYSGEEIVCADEEVLRSLYAFSVAHDVANLVGDALIKNGSLKKESEAYAKFSGAIFRSVLRFERSRHDSEAFFDALENAGIDFMPLKGAVIRDYYPRPEMRTSCDVDVFIEKKNVKKAVSVLTDGCGCKFISELYDEATLKTEGGVTLEIHGSLADGDDGNGGDTARRRYFKNAMNESLVKEGYKHYRLQTAEEFVAYFIYHSAKHFRLGGCGIKAIADAFVIKNKIRYDEKVLIRKLDRLKLRDFYDVLFAIAEKEFGSGEVAGDEEFKKIVATAEKFILSGGTYGGGNHGEVRLATTKGGKAGYIIKRAFLPYGVLKQEYPILVKAPVLYPFCTVHRWFSALFGKKKRSLKKEIQTSRSVTDERKEEISNLFDSLGV